jgi:hypothetical protein
MEHSFVCQTCKIIFGSHKKSKKYCSHTCYAKRFADVTNVCLACHSEFVVAYRFRGQKTCGAKCAGLLKSQNHTREIKNCLVCTTQFEAVQSYKDKAKYCSYDCFLTTRATRQPDIAKICENCEIKFVVPFTKNVRRFCSKRCATSGEFNAFFGMIGSAHPTFGLKAWNNGLSVETDVRLAKLGKKISVVSKEQFSTGARSHVGENNPMFGHTVDMLTPEQVENYSRAALKRVQDGVSGYKTGHLTGFYRSIKSGLIKFKSSWELAAMMWWDSCDNVVGFQYEPFSLILDDSRRAVPDFLVSFKDERSVLYEIKPTGIQNLTEVRRRLALAEKSANARGYAYFLLGDAEIKQTMISELGIKYEDAIKRYKSGK